MIKAFKSKANNQAIYAEIIQITNAFSITITALYITLCAALFFSHITIANAANEENKAPLSDKRKVELVHMVKQDCGSCHGMTLKGGLGPALLPENLKEKSVLFIQNTIFYGRPGTAMPPWQPILSQQEIIWISQQLKQGSFTH